MGLGDWELIVFEFLFFWGGGLGLGFIGLFYLSFFFFFFLLLLLLLGCGRDGKGKIGKGGKGEKGGGREKLDVFMIVEWGFGIWEGSQGEGKGKGIFFKLDWI